MTDTPKTIPVRDEGQEAREPVFETGEDGKIVTDENGVPKLITPGQEARNAWPKGNFIHLKPVMKGGDTNLVRKIQVRTQMTSNAAQPLEMSIEVYDQRIAYAAVLVKRIVGSWLRDQLDEAASLLGEGGEMPEMIADKVKVVSEIPNQVLDYLDTEMAEKINAPLAGSLPVSGEPTNESDSGAGSTTESVKPGGKRS